MAYETGIVYKRDKKGNAVLETNNGRNVILSKSNKRPIKNRDVFRFERYKKGEKIDFAKIYWKIPEITPENKTDELTHSITIAGKEVRYNPELEHFRLVRNKGKLRGIKEVNIAVVLERLKKYEHMLEQSKDELIIMAVEDCADYLGRNDIQRRKIEAENPHNTYDEGVRNTKRVLEQLI